MTPSGPAFSSPTTSRRPRGRAGFGSFAPASLPFTSSLTVGLPLIRPLIRIKANEAKALLNGGIVGVNRQQMMARGPNRPRLIDLIRSGKVVYSAFDPDEEWWTYDQVLDMIARDGVAYVDCEDLAGILAAELQVDGTDPRAFVHTYRAVNHTWHVVVGSPVFGWLDPSVAAGMRRAA